MLGLADASEQRNSWGLRRDASAGSRSSGLDFPCHSALNCKIKVLPAEFVNAASAGKKPISDGIARLILRSLASCVITLDNIGQ